ncbi:hypothetical protein KW798_02180 [Candidatus Parcubacteria bacterium]|nr:hypothetical protein [Candidatus Parcubacteria bacterium]
MISATDLEKILEDMAQDLDLSSDEVARGALKTLELVLLQVGFETNFDFYSCLGNLLFEIKNPTRETFQSAIALAATFGRIEQQQQQPIQRRRRRK